MTCKDTLESKGNNDKYLGARIPKKNKDFIEMYSKKMGRSAASQLIRILENMESGDIDAIAYELQSIGIKINEQKARQ